MNRPLLALLVIALIAGACAGGSGTGDDAVQREIDIYSTAIRTVAVIDRPDLTDDELDIVVYVWPLAEITISLDVQLGVVLALEDWATIRFIDEFEEAILVNEPNSPVRDHGVLVGLGEISDGPREATLAADRYEQADRLVAFDLVLQRRGGEWSVVEPIERTPVTLH